MNNKHYCPNCGAELKPGAKFCGNCGYRLDSNTNTPTRENKPKNKHYGLLIIVLLILIILLGIGSYYGYDALHSSSQNQTEINDAEPSKETAYKVLWHAFRDAQNKVNYGYQNNMPSYFDGGTSNNSYKQLIKWSKDEENASNLKKVTMQPSIWAMTPNHDHNVKFHVAYFFKHTNGSAHAQGFMWYAKISRINGHWKIISMTASPGATYDQSSSNGHTIGNKK